LPLQIFVEDQLTQAYEVLALKALRLPTTPRDRSRVRASRIDSEDLASMEGLLDLLKRAVASGYDCVMYVLDEEGFLRSPERTGSLQRFGKAFEDLCRYQRGLPAGNPLARARVVRVVCRRCLEGWLLADPQAVVDAVRGGRGVGFRPRSQQTERLLPEQAAAEIAHLIREVGRRLDRRDLRHVNERMVKSRGKDIAEHLELERARVFNQSLDYFLTMAECRQSGCDQPQPA